ncbi:fungal-specific transcription factor domain-containing protein [Pseudomassariella vexata]|uniref:Fungal-specific transcription factor domain-domain-containing protein n=1 Tax=Pseudomassariella vexata TaxID=1141098 RepID=A0A1Y2DEV2_9PEZI|nr:fungal-specific transcription factor domain-containing protein [Pseudomassariella vexata]ORY57779.1 fungal-specific transcription factor domain-domain-containing protein [Pseudomassariella vexata]
MYSLGVVASTKPGQVRCDKQMPCGNCRKAHISCIFPAPGRAPRRPRPKDPNAPPKQTSEREIELMKRLRKLEGIVDELSGQIEVERNPSSAADSPEDTTENVHERERRKEAAAISSNYPPSRSPEPGRLLRGSGTGNTSWGPLTSPLKEVNKEFGRLVLNDNGKTRYVSSAFWSKMNDELNQLRAETQQLTDENSEDSDDEGSSPDTVQSDKNQSLDHHAFIFGYRSCDVDLRKLHPLPSQIPFIWQVYTENVDPVVKILHVPTMNVIIRKLRSDMNNIAPGLEALMFSIYYAAITSMEDDEVKINFGAEKSHLIRQYRFATEQALAKANFLNTSELVVVQAFTIFLVLVRRYDDTRFSWTLTGLLIRISHSLGIHREGTHFADLSPFDIEMRRRLWWAVCILDLRSAEDQGTDLTIAEQTYDTQFPLNVNDSDISPDMKEFPRERADATDLTFCLIRYEICTLARRLHSASNAMAPCPKDTQLTLKEREDLLIDIYDRVEQKYLKPFTDQEGDLLNWVAAAIARLIMAKMSLIIYQPILFPHSPGQGPSVSEEVRDRLFTSSTEVVEYNKLLNSDNRCKQYRWLFQTYTQWHAVAFLLLEVCRRPWSAAVERAWRALSATFQDPEPSEKARLIQTQHRAVLLPIRKLMMKAKLHREEEIARLRGEPEAAKRLDRIERAKTPNPNFHNMPAAVSIQLAQEEWRKLVGVPYPENPPHDGCVDDEVPNGSAASNPHLPQANQQISVAQSQQVMDYMTDAMSQQTFNPQDFWSLVYPDESTELARQVIFENGLSGGISQPQPDMRMMPTQGSPVANKGGIPFPRDSLPTTQPVSQTPLPQSTTPATSAGMNSFVDDNPPPWLWSHTWGTSSADVTANLPAVDDGDVNMEEDFNWQDWQQSIKGLEMDAGVGMGMPGRSGGFSGGI